MRHVSAASLVTSLGVHVQRSASPTLTQRPPLLPQNCGSAGLNVQGVGVAYLTSTGCGLFYRFSWWICWWVFSSNLHQDASREAVGAARACVAACTIAAAHALGPHGSSASTCLKLKPDLRC